MQLLLHFCLLPEEEEGFSASSVVMTPLAKQETQVRSLGGEDPLEQEMATHAAILAWEVLWAEEPGGL